MADGYIRDQVEELFGGGRLHCAETVVRLVAEAGGRDSGEAVSMATGLCSGMSRSRGQCGAVSGAVMGIGLFAGRTEPGGEHEPAYAITQEFMALFTERFGSVNCYELCGCDFTVPEDQKRFKEDGQLEECLDMAAFAAETALSILREHGYLPGTGELVLERVAPCGLLCGNCLAFSGGPIQREGSKLKARLGENFAESAKRFEFMNPIFGKYPVFAEFLDFLAAGSCTGCRNQGCLFQSCRVPDCAREQGVDYCFQCAEFPCERHGFPERLEGKWRRNNGKMRETGPEKWYRMQKDKPRYP